MPVQIKQVCWACQGEGAYDNVTESGTYYVDPCNVCEGSGRIVHYRIGGADGVFWSYQIFEAVDPVEYNALSDANKSVLALMLGLGIIDLNEGTQSRSLLLSMFPAGTTTRTNLTELVT